MGRSLFAGLEAIVERARAADRVLLALDFDGTLSPIAGRPEDAALPPSTAAILSRLAARPDVTLAILSGRLLQDVRRRAGLRCIYAGNHGLEIEGPGVAFLHVDAVLRVPALECICAELEAALDGVEHALVERKGLTATAHFRRVPAESHGRVRDIVNGIVRRQGAGFEVVPARKAWEIRPRVDWDKGAALRFILERAGGDRPLVICAGDDASDEPMFTAVPGAISIRIGEAVETAARYAVRSPEELAAFLDRIR